MAQETSSTPHLSPTVPPTEPNSGQPSPPMLEQEPKASEAPTADAVAKRERPNVSITLNNSPAAFGPSELATPPATASSETMHIPTPAKQAYQPQSPAANLPVVHSPVEKTDESVLKSPPATDSQSDSSAKSFDSDASSLAPPLKRRLSEASLDEDAAAAENAKKGRRNGKMFQCTGFGDCSMCFTRSEHLARHIRKHTGERPFECKCGRAFSRLDNLRQHIYTVHASEPQNYQTIKQCLPVHIPKKKDLKQTMSIAPPQPVAVLPSMAQVLPMGPGMAPMMMPAMGPHPSAGPHASPIAPGPAAPGVAHLPQQPPASAQQQQPMVAPAGYQAPTPAKAADQALACPPNTSQLPGSRLQPVYFPQQAAAHAPAFVYVSDMPQMYCMPQQQLQLMPQYMTQYSYPVPLAYPPAAAPALGAKPAQPPSPPISQATSPQVHMAPLPQ